MSDRVSYREAGEAHRAVLARAVAAGDPLKRPDWRVLAAVIGLTASYSRVEDMLSVGQIAAAAGYSERTTSRALALLVKAGVLWRFGGGGRGKPATVSLVEPTPKGGSNSTRVSGEPVSDKPRSPKVRVSADKPWLRQPGNPGLRAPVNPGPRRSDTEKYPEKTSVFSGYESSSVDRGPGGLADARRPARSEDGRSSTARPATADPPPRDPDELMAEYRGMDSEGDDGPPFVEDEEALAPLPVQAVAELGAARVLDELSREEVDHHDRR